MKLNTQFFSTPQKIAYKLGLYNLTNILIDYGFLRKDLYYSPLFKRSTTQVLLRHYGAQTGHKINMSTGNLGFGFLHYAFINLIRPERILCIGSQYGFIPAMFALACKDNKWGHVDFVDAGKEENEPGSWGGVGFWKKNKAKDYFSVLDLSSRITVYLTTTKQFARKSKGRKWEYIYIDGDHSYNGIKTDYNLFWPRLTNGGMMGFHDISLRGLYHGQEYGVSKFWKELKQSYKFYFNFGESSLGFIQKNE
jgi:hypothetical protein